MSARIDHVSDTALLVAASRALESARPDGLIQDPYAARLAGDRGMALIHNVAVPQWIELGISMRTRFIDEFLRSCIEQGVDAVLNLGAGLDARPWRLNIPSSLRWTEVDFPQMLDYKYELLAGASPRCRLDRQSADLNDSSQRSRILTNAASGASRPLLLTEGLLMYLPAETVQALASDALNAGFQFWLMDSTSPALMRRAHGDSVQHINRVRAESHLEGPQIRDVVVQRGWKPADRRLFVDEAPKLARERILKIIEAEGRPPDVPPPNDGSGVWLYRSDGSDPQVAKTQN